MPAPLTPAGEAAVTELAERYRVSDGAVRGLLDAVIRGGGTMAQFSHPELGGRGQWMRGGMTMVGDMFNPGLQATVSGICSELSSLLAGGTVLVSAPDRHAAAGSFGAPVGQWWPDDLGRPSSSGGQNDDSYAYFPATRRLAIRRGAAITVFDTGDHAISGVQQQQGGRGSLEFSSQLGTFTVDTLPVVSGTPDAGRSPTAPPVAAPVAPAAVRPVATQSQSQSGASMQPPKPDPAAPPPPPDAPAPPPPPAEPAPAAPPIARAPSASTPAEIGAAIETLAGLRDKGYLTDDEFTTKKTELLARL